MSVLKLESIAFDAGTQIRAALDPQLVTDYAEAMTSGAKFPPIVVFHDGNQHYLADGFHRFMAAQRNQWREIEAEIRPGTKEDALWFALGANRANGKRLTEADKTHAVELARATWPDKLQREIAEQVGCHPSLVSHVYQKLNASEPVSTGRERRTNAKREMIKQLIGDGIKAEDIAKQVGVSRTRVCEVRVELGLSRSLDRSKGAIAERHEQMRTMAGEGYSSRQIAAAVGMTDMGCRTSMRELGIEVPADRAVGRTKRHDANRIIDRIVTDAENLTEGVELIDYTVVDGDRLGEWIDSLIASQKKLSAFIRHLKDHHREQTAVVA